MASKHRRKKRKEQDLLSDYEDTEEKWDLHRTYRRWGACVWVMMLGFMIGASQMLPFVTSVLHPEQGGFTQISYDEIVVQKDPATRRYGFVYTDSLMITAVDKGSPAEAAGLGKYKGRTIRRCNGVGIRNSGDFQRVIVARDHRTSLIHHITLDFVPLFLVGGAVRAVKRIVLRNSQVIPQGTLGVITSVPGSAPDSPAQVRLNGVRFDAHPSQVEPVIESDSVPKRFDERPAWIYRGRGAKDVEIIINELEYARYGYFQKLVDFGVDRLDHLASLGANDAALLKILPLHFNTMRELARKVVRERQRLCNHDAAEKIAYKELGYLFEAEEEAQRRALDEGNRIAAEMAMEMDKNAMVPDKNNPTR
eukprot:TRINITY_DN3846_c4_g1_i3.p1 TRINITY_DN3846_c4_g1~~TRINITY_DN3846_c4_g1_i3.p1  ORF type:complete len:365 (+),score=70.71 TRINITY_DN3846_c4_g1_i3:93-1187(+)